MPVAMPVTAGPSSGRSDGVSTRILLLACLPAVAAGLLVRVWLMRTSLSALNADEGVTGVQAFEVLKGHFRLMVAGNDYGSTTETYRWRPLLRSDRVGGRCASSDLLSAVAAYALIVLRCLFAECRPRFWRDRRTTSRLALMFLRLTCFTQPMHAPVAALRVGVARDSNEHKLARTAVSPGSRRGSPLEHRFRCSRCWR